MKTFECIGTQPCLYKIRVKANSKSEAIKKVRIGEDIISAIPLVNIKGYALSGGGYINMKEIIDPSDNPSK